MLAGPLSSVDSWVFCGAAPLMFSRGWSDVGLRLSALRRVRIDVIGGGVQWGRTPTERVRALGVQCLGGLDLGRT